MTSVMQRYSLAQLEPGMELGQDILNHTGTILLTQGTILTTSLLNHLARLGIEEVNIREAAAYQNKVITLDKIKLQLLHQAAQQVKDSFIAIEKYGKVPVKIFENVANNHILPLVNSHSAINYLNTERSKDDYLYNHSVNVGLLSGLIGKWSSCSNDEVTDLILTGLLHDVGKTRIPPEILNRPGKLSEQEMEVVRLHSTHSFGLINGIPDLPKDVMFGILQHHERLDGSGYPGHFKEGKIHRYARIVAIADIYDAMTSDRNYSAKANPFAVADALAKDMYSKLDAEICTTFLKEFRNFIMGNRVQLDDGREVEIVYTGHFLDLNPTVRTADGEFLSLPNWRCITKMIPFKTSEGKS